MFLVSAKLESIFKKQPEQFGPYQPRLVDSLRNEDSTMQTPLIQMFAQVANNAPNVRSCIALRNVFCQFSDIQATLSKRTLSSLVVICSIYIYSLTHCPA